MKEGVFMDWKTQHKDIELHVDLMQFLLKFCQDFICRCRKAILKFIWRGTGTTLSSTILKKKNKVGRLILLDIKAYLHSYKTVVLNRNFSKENI